MRMWRLAAILVTLGLGSSAIAGQAKQDDKPPIRLPIVAKPGVWQPGPDGKQIPLWPADMPLAKPDTGDHPEETGNGSGLVAGRPWHWAGYVTRPTMTIYRPKRKNTHSAMLVLPGGGFSAVAMDLEGTEICDWVVRQGMTCVILKYRAPQEWPKDPKTGVGQRPRVLLALQDAERAMGLLRHDAAKYGIDPHQIGVIGFSAGAYLAANLSNVAERNYTPVDAADREPTRPNFAIMLYTGRLWDRTRAKTDLTLAPWVTIRKDAPPTLMFQAMNDPTDNVRHAMAYALALNDAGVPVEMHLYATGGHAFGLRKTNAAITTEWPNLAVDWLRRQGMLRKGTNDGTDR